MNNVQNVEVASGQWLWQVGVLDSKYTGVQLTGIAFTDKRGKVEKIFFLMGEISFHLVNFFLSFENTI